MHPRLNTFKITECLACAIVLAQVAGPVWVIGQTNPEVRQKANHEPPPLPAPKPPIAYFRELLAMSPGEREHSLADKSPESKKILLAKLKEYESMESEKRELKLRVTELRWYLTPLMKLPPAQRGEWLAAIPAEKLPFVEERLRQWDELSASQQKEFWENEMAINYFLRWQSSTPDEQTNFFKNISAPEREKLEKELAQWRSMPAEQRERMCNRFEQFFDLNLREKKKTLNTLSESERIQMEKTLETFQSLPVEQRRHCINSFRKFAGMDATERNQFFKKAELWQDMSSADREAWRELVQKLPRMPPLPPGLRLTPPLPPSPLMATNYSR